MYINWYINFNRILQFNFFCWQVKHDLLLLNQLFKKYINKQFDNYCKTNRIINDIQLKNKFTYDWIKPALENTRNS